MLAGVLLACGGVYVPRSNISSTYARIVIGCNLLPKCFGALGAVGVPVVFYFWCIHSVIVA